ncbi:IS1595 family transposase [Aquimarina sp. I32.4]|uniref:IS1595 family transposase n=1 Tax=Aquimarina sp. I32.4 TaxID=2053903 RepID=UPI000CDE60F6|nr:IS1595 family transposase [Aquimarina sp. I32.4]
MILSKLKGALLLLESDESEKLLAEVRLELNTEIEQQIISRREILNNKQGACPHCSEKTYIRTGIDKGSQRYKCKSCMRSFTEYTGTWMARLRCRDVISDYLELMLEEKSLDKISTALNINKKTAFDWRHKILAALNDNDNDQDDFTGITESDETFFLRSEKGIEVKQRESRKRGGSSTKRGVSNDQVAVIVTQDRKSAIDISVATLGRISMTDLDRVIGTRIKKGTTILCSDSHHSYKGFAKQSEVEFHPINVSKQERVKGVYHIQHVNATHNKLKKWIENTFWGVSTKYLQQYLNWYKVKELLKNTRDKTKTFSQMALSDKAIERFFKINSEYEKLIT